MAHKTLAGRTCRVTSQARNCLFHRRMANRKGGAKFRRSNLRGRRSGSPRRRARSYKRKRRY